MNSDGAARRFREVLEADRASGKMRSLSAYLRLFQGFDDVVRVEYARLVGDAPPTPRKAERGRAAPSPPVVAPYTPAGPPPDDRDSGPSPAGDVLDRLTEGDGRHYHERGEIARGGMGAIFSIRDETLHRDLAMKVILGEEGSGSGSRPELTPAVDRFLAEAQVTAQLDHPGVVPVHELGVDGNGRLYFTMKLVKGRTLDAVFALIEERAEHWSRTRAVQLLIRVCETLSFAHSKGVIHRDLKPANIMVGDFGEVYVMDWGLSKVLGAPETEHVAVSDQVRTVRAGSSGSSGGSHETQAGSVVGTAAYMPPEQAGGLTEDLDARADVYAVGAILYQLLAGHPPYGGPDGSDRTIDVLRGVVTGPPTPLADVAPDLPGEIVAICEKAMARRREARYASAADLAQDLRDFIEGRVVRAYRTGTLIELRKWIGRNPALASSVAAVFVLLIAGLTITRALLVDARISAEEALRQNHRLSTTMASEALAAHRPMSARRWLEEEQSPERRATWEWRHLHARLDDAYARVAGRRGAFDADGRLLVVTDDGRVVAHAPPEFVPETIWEASRGRALRVSPDARFVVVERPASAVFEAAVCDLESGERVLDLADATLQWVAFGEARNEVFFHDGERFAAFDLDTRRERVAAVGGAPNFVRVARTAPALYLSSDTGSRRLWRHAADTLERTVVVAEHADSIIDCEIAWDGRLIVTSGYDDTVSIWDPATPGTPVAAFACPPELPAHAVAISPDSATVAATHGDHSLRFIATEGATLLTTLHDTNVSFNIVYSPDGTWIASEHDGEGLVLWAADARDDPRVLAGHASFVYSVTFSPDGQRIASAGWDGFAGEPGSVRIWDAATGDLIVALCDADEHVTSLRYARLDQRLVLVGAGTRRDASAMRVWDAETGEPIELPWPDEAGTALDVSPDGTHVIVATGGDTATLIQLAPFQVLGGRPHHVCQGAGLGFVDDTRFLALHRRDEIEMSGGPSAAPVAILDEHDCGQLWAVAHSADGRRFATAGDNDAVTIWNTADQRQLARLEGHGGAALSVAFSPDGTRIVTGGRDGLVHVWDAERFSEVVALSGHETYVKELAYSPDGSMLVSASGDGTLRIWETRPLRDRLRDRHERRRLVEALSQRIDELLARAPTVADAVAQLRADGSLDERAREVALQLVLRESERRRREDAEDR